MTTGASLDVIQPVYFWASEMCEMRDSFNLQWWIFMVPDQIETLLVISVYAIYIFSVRHETGGSEDTHTIFCLPNFPFLFIFWRCRLINIATFH